MTLDAVLNKKRPNPILKKINLGLSRIEPRPQCQTQNSQPKTAQQPHAGTIANRMPASPRTENCEPFSPPSFSTVAA
jgi:hypothetical protein